MYSMKATPIMIMAHTSTGNVSAQIDVVDEGYGVRAKEFERVFMPFERARQPQIIGEFGYGLSLYLCKQEVEAMNGKVWFESEEGVGTTPASSCHYGATTSPSLRSVLVLAIHSLARPPPVIEYALVFNASLPSVRVGVFYWKCPVAS
ncbi:MAG: ATP-binding protein [Anaerolineae bacterium]